MVDYTRSTGNSGTMLIRDTGLSVEFWLHTSSGSTWSDHIPWGYTVDGFVHNGSYNYPPGAGWRKLGQRNATYNQTVQFRLGNTGTSGFGGPTTFNQFIQRATVPPAPNPPVLTDVTHNSMHVEFTGNGDGGSVIFIWQTAYGTDPTGAIADYVNDFEFDLDDLPSGVTYYFWARGQNAQGWGPWSARSQATTLRVPDAPSSPVITDVTQVSATATFTPNGDGGTSITGFQVGYGVYSSAPVDVISATSPQAITGLSPGTRYYFFTRAQNAVGWGPWSEPTMVKTVAGARLLVIEGGVPVWKDAVPYVKVSGVWKVARPWVKVVGVWKESV